MAYKYWVADVCGDHRLQSRH